MEDDILFMLEDLCYTGSITEDIIKASVQGPTGGPSNVTYIEVVGWVTRELRILCQLDAQATSVRPASPEKPLAFLMEVLPFIEELGCPYKELRSEAVVSQQLACKENRLLLLCYLLRELQAARMTVVKQNEGIKYKMEESDPAKDLKAIMVQLLLPQPPRNVTSSQLFLNLKEKVHDVLSKAEPFLIGEPLLRWNLSEKKWKLLEQMWWEMDSQFQKRRQMLILKLDNEWLDRAKADKNELLQAFHSRRNQFSDKPNVTLWHLLAARDDLPIFKKFVTRWCKKNRRKN